MHHLKNRLNPRIVNPRIVNPRIVNLGLWILLTLVLLVACSDSTPDGTPTVPNSRPEITLTASEDIIMLGQPVQLSWQVASSTPVTITLTPDTGAGSTSMQQGFRTVSPTSTTTYTLTASNAVGSASESLTVTVVTEPTVTDFSVAPAGENADPTSVTVTFDWRVVTAERLSCTLDVGDGSTVVRFDDCRQARRSTHSYSQPGVYDAVLTLENGSQQTLRVRVLENNTIAIVGFVDEQSRNVIIIMTDEDGGEQAVTLEHLNKSIAAVEASRGFRSDAPAIRGANAAVFGLLQTQQAMPSSGTTPLFNFAREFVVAVTSEGEVVATSPLDRFSEAGDETRLEFNLDIPSEDTVALLVAEPDGRDGWVCKGLLEYQTLSGQRTVSSSQTLYQFDEDLAGNDTPFNTGRFQFNELTANLASRTVATSTNVMVEDIPSPEVQAATLSLDDAPEFQDGIYRFCANPNVVENQVTADINWRGDIFETGILPPGANPDLNQGEAAVYDFSIAMLLESISEQDDDGNTITSNRLLGTSPIDEDGNVNINLVRSALENINATLFFTDVAFFDASKQRFPLTPSYEFDASTQLGRVQSQQGTDTIDPDVINLGEVDGGLAYISGQITNDAGEPVPFANVIMVLDSEQLAFNVAVADENGFYELLIPSDLANDYILYGQDPAATLGGIASNDDTGVRFEVRDADIIAQEDIVLDVPLPDVIPPMSAPPVVDAGEDIEVTLGDSVILEATASDPDGDVLTLRWQIVTRPAGSNATLDSSDALSTGFTPDVIGDYDIRFSAFDGEMLTADLLTVSVLPSDTPNNVVQFVAPSVSELVEGESFEVTLERTGNTDADLTARFQLASAATTSPEEITITGATEDNGRYNITFAAGETRAAFEVTATDDGETETPEVFALELVTSPNYDLGDPTSISIDVVDADVPPDTAPVISSLTATPASIAPGEDSVLMWNISGSDPIILSISPRVGDTLNGNSLTVSPTETTTYTLTASNPLGSVSAEVTVTVGGVAGPVAPTITSFTATPSAISAGENSTLAWSVTGDEPITLTIEPGVGDVSGLSSVEVSPTETTTYTLTASNAVDTVSSSVTVQLGFSGQVTLNAPSSIEGGDDFTVNFTGPDESGDYITVVAVGTPEGSYRDYFYTPSTAGSGTLTAQTTAGDYEIRYITGDGGVTLARIPIAVTPPISTLEAPDSIEGGDNFIVNFTGPDAPGDYVTIVAVGTPEGSYRDYFYPSSTAGSGTLTAQTTAGEYEIRYVINEGDVTIARIPITVTPPISTLEAPDTVEGGSSFIVNFTGPDASGDYVTVVRLGSPEGSYRSYFYPSSTAGSGTLTAQTTAGDYEIRYVINEGDVTIARRPITVTPPIIVLEAPDTVAVGEEFFVNFTGPDASGDFVTIVPVGAPEGDYESYFYPSSREGSGFLTAADTAGSYEIRYVLGEGNVTAGSVPITVF